MVQINVTTDSTSVDKSDPQSKKKCSLFIFCIFQTILIIISGTEFDIVRKKSALKVFTLEEAIEEASKYSFFSIFGSKVMK